MLDYEVAKIVHKKINTHLGSPKDKNMVSLESVCRMEPIATDTKIGGKTVFALQYGKSTILVWIEISDSLGAMILGLKTIDW